MEDTDEFSARLCATISWLIVYLGVEAQAGDALNLSDLQSDQTLVPCEISGMTGHLPK